MARKESEQMRIGIRVDREVYKKFKMYSIMHDKSMNVLISDYIEKIVKDNKKLLTQNGVKV